MIHKCGIGSDDLRQYKNAATNFIFTPTLLCFKAIHDLKKQNIYFSSAYIDLSELPKVFIIVILVGGLNANRKLLDRILAEFRQVCYFENFARAAT